MSIKKTLLFAVATVFFIVGAYFLYSYLSENYTSDTISIIEDRGEITKSEEPSTDDTAETQSKEETKYTVPDFTVTDKDGNKVSLSDCFGKPIIVNFWASWCPPCKREMPDFEEAYKKYGDEIIFMMINMTGGRETIESAKNFIENSSFTFPVYFDTEYEAAMTYGVSSIPQTLFIDENGRLKAYAQGIISKESLDTGISMIYNTNTTISE